MLLEKISENDDKKYYNNVMKEYYKFISPYNINTDKGPFIGPQPAQILPKNVPHLLKNTVITPKIDGKRYLCIVKKNTIGFVDRGMDFYYPVKLSKKSNFVEINKIYKRNIENVDYKIKKLKKNRIFKLNLLKLQHNKKEYNNEYNKKINFLLSKEKSMRKDYKNVKEKLKTNLKKGSLSELPKIKKQLLKYDFDEKIKNLRKKQKKRQKEIEILIEKDNKKLSKKKSELLKKRKQINDNFLKQLFLFKELKRKNEDLKKSNKVDDKKSIYIIKNNKIVKTEKFSMSKNKKFLNKISFNLNSDSVFLFDCEIVENKSGILQIFLFDIVMINRDGKIEKIYNKPFYERINHLYGIYNDLIKKINIPCIKFYYKMYFDYRLKDMSYNNLLDVYNKEMKFKKEEKPEYDGVIFVNTLYKYYLGPGFARGQYKWKPKNKLTIDLKIVEENSKWKAFGKYNKVIEINGKDISKMLDTKDFKKEYNNKVYEFLYKNGKFVLHKPIIERTTKGANAYATIKSTIEAGENHFSLKTFQKMVNYINKGMKLNNKTLEWMDKETSLKIIALCNGKNFIENPEVLKKDFKKFYSKNPFIKTLSEKQIEQTKLADNMIKGKMLKIVKYINTNLYDNKINMKEMLQYIVKNNLLYRTHYNNFINKLYKKFDNHVIPKFKNNQKMDNLEYKGFSEKEIKSYMNQKEIKYKIDFFINDLTSSFDELEYMQIKNNENHMKNYNKFIRVSFQKSGNSKMEISNKSDDFYKLISFFNHLTNRKNDGIKSKMKVLGKYNIIFDKNDTIMLKNVKMIEREHIESSTLLEYNKHLGYDVKIDMGYLAYYSKNKLKSLTLGNHNNYTIKTSYFFIVPGFPWIINLVKIVNYESSNKENNSSKKSVIREKQIREQMIENENTIKNVNYEIEAVLNIKKNSGENVESYTTNFIKEINLVVNKYFKYLIF